LIGYTLRVYQWIRVRMTPFGRGNMYYEPAILECIKSSQRVNNRELQWYRSYPALPQVNAVVRQKRKIKNEIKKRLKLKSRFKKMKTRSG